MPPGWFQHFKEPRVHDFMVMLDRSFMGAIKFCCLPHDRHNQ
jgi:hypothetical protein